MILHTAKAEHQSGQLYNVGYPCETHLKTQNLFAYNLSLSSPVVLQFYTEHGSDTAVLCAKFQNEWTTETNVMDEQDFARFDFS